MLGTVQEFSIAIMKTQITRARPVAGKKKKKKTEELLVKKCDLYKLFLMLVLYDHLSFRNENLTLMSCM